MTHQSNRFHCWYRVFLGTCFVYDDDFLEASRKKIDRESFILFGKHLLLRVTFLSFGIYKTKHVGLSPHPGHKRACAHARVLAQVLLLGVLNTTQTNHSPLTFGVFF